MPRTLYSDIELVPAWRYWIRWLPLFKLPEDLVVHYETVNLLRENKENKLSNIPLQLDGLEGGENMSDFLAEPARSPAKCQDASCTTKDSSNDQIDDINKSCHRTHSRQFDIQTANSNSRAHLSSDDTIHEDYPLNSEKNYSDDEELDLLDFLNKGPKH